MPIIEAPPPELAAEPQRSAFPARGWKRDINNQEREAS
ncbi:hypothetical protein GXM_02105 [Nostoc sphaeroides CCNUC1]|uniref:Uncharacterized protein n=1 Tax=Nostoc sphaeroides CCNUC1 TaxID=2653204 RepID=A0A5P8VW68_9NOSO|nr:hypothetical protein GXM_02105 [Nostoc sphaeroides CCNUC1]